MARNGKLKKLYCIQLLMTLLCMTGVIVSYYAYHVETTKEKNPEYKAMCDISEHMSCSEVLTSRYGKGFGFMHLILGTKSNFYHPNSIYGIIFYTLLGFLAQSTNTRVLFVELVLVSASCVMSVYLACILYFILYDFCVVCVSTYVINVLLLICNIYRRKYCRELRTGPKED